MAAGLEAALGESVLQQKQVTGWLNVPADCVRPLQRIKLHAARPAGVNEPTPEGVEGCSEILRRVQELDQDDLCLCLLSGGGSALLPAPAPGVTLAQKLAITRHLSAAGANIQQLNTVRKQLSRIKGGGLARACGAGTLITLIISDVLGDPLDVIASGPTVPDTTTPQDAWDILRQFPLSDSSLEQAVCDYLRHRMTIRQPSHLPTPRHTRNFIIGNNAVAVDAAGSEAERRGYSHAMVAARQLEGEAESVGRHLARLARQMRETPGPDCLITGGEPTVTLADPSVRGWGGRNQQLALAALDELTRSVDPGSAESSLAGIALLAGGTDGEDGPTDAAGALIDGPLAEAVRRTRLDIADYLRRNDAYHFFQQLDGLLKTGPTHTNVCDVRVVVVDRVSGSERR
jgi:hydroxypyruvate reductase